MRPKLLDPPLPHGGVGLGVAVVVFGLAGLLVLTAAVGSAWVPAWLPAASGSGGAPLRAAAGALGVALVVIAFGLLRFRRWAWWGGLVWAVWSAVEVARSLGPAVVAGIPLPQFLAVCAIPYLWVRRRDFGVGSGPRRSGRLSSTLHR